MSTYVDITGFGLLCENVSRAALCRVYFMVTRSHSVLMASSTEALHPSHTLQTSQIQLGRQAFKLHNIKWLGAKLNGSLNSVTSKGPEIIKITLHQMDFFQISIPLGSGKRVGFSCRTLWLTGRPSQRVKLTTISTQQHGTAFTVTPARNGVSKSWALNPTNSMRKPSLTHTKGSILELLVA